MNWFLIALIHPFLWGITNYIDKYLLSKYFHNVGIGALMIFSSAIGLVLLPIIALIQPSIISSFEPTHLLIVLNGAIFMLALLPHLHALRKADTSLIIPLFQMIPVFTYLIGYLVLGEVLADNQILGGVLIILSSIFISLDIAEIRRIRMKWDVFWLMALSSLLFAVNFVFFKFFSISTDFWTTSFWEYVGFVLVATFFLSIRSYREGFLKIFRTNRFRVLSINGINEVLNIAAKITFNFATLLAPVVLVNVVGGLQPLFVFLMGIAITIFLPKITVEDISRRTLLQRGFAIVVIIIGSYLINQNGG